MNIKRDMCLVATMIAFAMSVSACSSELAASDPKSSARDLDRVPNAVDATGDTMLSPPEAADGVSQTALPPANEDPSLSSTPSVTTGVPGSSIALVTSRKPLIVLGRQLSGELRNANGCLVVEIEGRTATAVFPPSARVRDDGNRGQFVVFGNREIAIGETANIPDGGEVAISDLALPLPPVCPSQLYSIGG
ncbi:hypothetical protein [Parasphingorhabdus sp.]|uniref:hypothetical protein n=1 Tax=Parasphingorhabdus sp. TaxID=2709688 RepID=UPI0030027AE9